MEIKGHEKWLFMDNNLFGYLFLKRLKVKRRNFPLLRVNPILFKIMISLSNKKKNKKLRFDVWCAHYFNDIFIYDLLIFLVDKCDICVSLQFCKNFNIKFNYIIFLKNNFIWRVLPINYLIGVVVYIMLTFHGKHPTNILL